MSAYAPSKMKVQSSRKEMGQLKSHFEMYKIAWKGG